MAEFFKGLAVKAGIMRSDEQEKLDNMIETYTKGGSRGHRDTAETIQVALAASPDLKARTLEAVRDGHLRTYSDIPVQGAGSASYQAHDQSMRIAPQVGKNDAILIDKIFTLGHETEHARSLKGVDYAKQTLLPAINTVARAESHGPRDYTGIIDAFAERTRAEEGRAHIGGFNAVASHIITDHKPKPEHLLRDLYEAYPARMGDFIQKSSVGHPPDYALKPGLQLGRDGMLPYSAQNIEAMKVHYADKAQLGAPHMNYRQECIEFASDLVKKVEKSFAEIDSEDRSYVIDPTRLKAHPAHGLPADGVLQVQGMARLQDLGIDLSALGPLVVSSSQPTPPLAGPSQAVLLVPQPDDHPMFAQALTKVVEYHRTDKLSEDPQELRNLAAALAVAAHGGGMDRIDKITLSKDSLGVIASQGEAETGRNVRVEGLAGTATPEAENLARLPAAVQALPQPLSRQEPVVIAESSGPTTQKI